MNIDELMLNLEAARRMLGGEAEVKIVLPGGLEELLTSEDDDLEGTLLHINSERFSVHTPDGAAWIYCLTPDDGTESRYGDKNEEVKRGPHYRNY